MRRLLLVVVLVDLVGGAALAYALTRSDESPARQPQAQRVALLAHPQVPLAITVATTPPGLQRSTSGHAQRSAGVEIAQRRLLRRRPPQRQAVGCSFDIRGAERAVEAETATGYRVGFALQTASGHTLAAVNADAPSYGASITKSMLLVAYLRDHAGAGLDTASIHELTSMIVASDNTAGDWVYAHLRSPAADVDGVADAAGMSGFRLDTSDPVYTLGQSLITARSFAGFFARIGGLMPSRYRAFGMNLLAHVEQRVGLLAAGLPGTVYSKEGWKPERTGLLDAPYLVDQAAQFSCRGLTYGIAVTIGHAGDEAAAEAAVQHLVGVLMD